MRHLFVPLLALSVACGGSSSDREEARFDLRGPTRSTWQISPIDGSADLDLAIEIRDADGVKLTRFTPIHTQPMHLIAIGSGLTLAAHEHPALDAQGTFTVRLPLPGTGSYVLFDEYDPAGVLPHAIDREELDTAPGGSLFGPASWDLQTRQRVVDGLTFKLVRDSLMLGHGMPLVVEVSDATGGPAALDTWLGAKGHMLATQDGAPRLYHFHPGEGGHGGHRPRARGTSLSFHAEVGEPGNYRLFVQVVKAGETAPTTAWFDVTAR